MLRGLGISKWSNAQVSLASRARCCIYISTANSKTVDKMEQMLGSYGPSPSGEAYTKNFEPEESPSGLLARSGTYFVRSRVVDDDGEVYAGELLVVNPDIFQRLIVLADWEWYFKIGKEW